jgi:3-deoxy-7-phosphoheptulonate synthase
MGDNAMFAQGGLAKHQPEYENQAQYEQVLNLLSHAQAVVSPTDIQRLHEQLAALYASPTGFLIQAGDCAESVMTPPALQASRAQALRQALCDRYHAVTQTTPLYIGRVAGQYAKPRSDHVETQEGQTLPSYLGDAVNRVMFSPEARKANPEYLLEVHRHALATYGALKQAHGGMWISHEALLLGYEEALIRAEAKGGLYLSATHLPWIGYRTFFPGSAHVALLASTMNPVGFKLGAGMTPEVLLEALECFNPENLPGKVLLIARYGATEIQGGLRPLVQALARAGKHVLWMVDPMHGNTYRDAEGRKRRAVEKMLQEIAQAVELLANHGTRLHGLHLEATSEDVQECVWTEGLAEEGSYTTLCDPRLNLEQAAHVVEETARMLGG